EAAECTGPDGARVQVFATASDACSSTVSITGSRSAGADASGVYPLGTTPVTFTATDASGNVATCTTSVMVRDTRPPRLVLTLSPSVLWPPNHRMLAVQTAWQVTDACDPVPSMVLASATSTEPDDAPANFDGNTTGDIQDASIGTPDTTVLMRAERSGEGPGRVYALTYVARDAPGKNA